MSTTSQELTSYKAAVKQLSTGNDQREEMRITISTIADWDLLIQPAPLSIALLGELMVVACDAKRDFVIKPDGAAFKYLKYDHFRPCLVQLTHAGETAFNTAHRNMLDISKYSEEIPKLVTDVVKILLGGTQQEISILLPRQIAQIKSQADSCVRLAGTVEQRFVDVMNISGELLEACVSAQGIYGNALRDTEIAREIALINKTNFEDQAKFAKEQHERMVKQLDQAQDMFKDAVDSMPSGWDIIGMQIVEGLSNALLNAANGALSMYTGGMINGGTTKGPLGAPLTSPPSQVSTTPTPQSADPSWAFAPQIITFSTTLETATVITDGKPAWKSDTDPVTMFKIVDKNLENIRKFALGNPVSDVSTRAAGLCTVGIELAQRLAKFASELSPTDEEQFYKDTAEKSKKLLTDSRLFASESSLQTSASPIGGQGPSASAAPVPNASGSAADAAIKNAQFKVSQTKENLTGARQLYDKATDRVSESNQKLGEVLAELAKLDLQKIDFETIRQSLKRGIETVSKLREEWGKLVRFFQQIASVICVSFDETLKRFLNTADTGLLLGGIDFKSILKDMLYSQAMESSTISYAVHIISTTYVKISEKYLMDTLHGLDKIMALNIDTDATQIAQVQQKLEADAKNSIAGIEKEVAIQSAEFELLLTARLDKVTTILQKSLPAPPKEEQLAQKEILKEANEKVQEIKKEESVDDWL